MSKKIKNIFLIFSNMLLPAYRFLRLEHCCLGHYVKVEVKFFKSENYTTKIFHQGISMDFVFIYRYFRWKIQCSFNFLLGIWQLSPEKASVHTHLYVRSVIGFISSKPTQTPPLLENFNSFYIHIFMTFTL